MVHKQLILVVLLIFVGSIVEGRSIYGSRRYGVCWKYGPEHKIPDVEGEYWSCFYDFSDFSRYCILVNCPETKCNKPILTSGWCANCLGTCSYGGKVYKVGDSFTCIDGTNRCRCLHNNDIEPTTFLPVNFEAMCNKTLT